MPPELAIILLCLAVTAYMIASLFFPPLRFIFGLKRFAASAAGVDDEDNFRLASGLGLVLAPIIAIAALLFAGYVGLQWKDSVETRKLHAQMREDELNRQFADLQAILSEPEITKISFYRSRPKLALSEAGNKEVEAFLPALGNTLTKADLDSAERNHSNWNDWLTAEIPRELGPKKWTFYLALSPDDDRILARGISSPGDDVLFHCPASLTAQFDALMELERVDLDALQREERARQREEQRQEQAYVERLMNYQGRSLSGPSHQSIRRKLDEEGADLDALREEFVGSAIQWEMRSSGTTGTRDGRIKSNCLMEPGQNHLKTIKLEAPAGVFPDREALGKVWWIRVTGKITGIDRAVVVTADSIEPFTPPVRGVK